MKKKIAILLVIAIIVLSSLTGCNLTITDSYASLGAIVARSGDYVVTREELLNAYNSTGYYYFAYYGLTKEDAVKRTIGDILDRKYLLDYIDKLSKTDDRYAISSDDYDAIVSTTWDYIDSSLKPFVTQVRKDLGLSVDEVKEQEEDKKEPEYAPQKQYETKFKMQDGKIYLISKPSDSDIRVHEVFEGNDAEDKALEYAKTFDYKKQIKSKSVDYKNMIWSKFISTLKFSQKHSKYKDMSDKACFDREIERVFKINLLNKKLTKFEEISKASNGYNHDEDGYYLNDSVLDDMVDYYKKTLNSNIDMYSSMAKKDDFYNSLVSKTNRDDIFYYGKPTEEELITCSHILIKLSQEQIDKIKSIKNSTSLPDEAKTSETERIKSETRVFERSLETGEEIDKEGILLTTMYDNLRSEIRDVSSLEEKTEIFNKYLYKYNVDKGIINAKYDYVVGTKNSTMVQSFTDRVRKFLSDGEAVGSISEPVFEDSSSYTGFHIIFYTGVLKNIFNSKEDAEILTKDNIYDFLGDVKTCLSYNETFFEYVYDKVIKDNYNTFKLNTCRTLESGKDIYYNNAQFSDLIKK